MKKRSILKSSNFLTAHIKNNISKYVCFSAIFIVGLVAGIIITNSLSYEQRIEISQYINDFINGLNNNINQLDVLKNSLIQNIIMAIVVWTLGSTILGIPIICAIIAYKGFLFGYTISCITLALGSYKSILFCTCGFFIQNIIFIFGLFALGVSSINYSRALLNDRNQKNIRLELYRHSAFCALTVIIMGIGSIAESMASYNLLKIISDILI